MAKKVINLANEEDTDWLHAARRKRKLAAKVKNRFRKTAKK